MPFTTPLVVMVLEEEWDGRALVRLLEPMTYIDNESEVSITVPAGFVSDFLSIPWFSRLFFTPFDKGAKAGVVHDWLLYSGIMSKKEAHKVFRSALKDLGVSRWRRTFLYWAVHWPFVKKVTQPNESYQGA